MTTGGPGLLVLNSMEQEYVLRPLPRTHEMSR
jgi:hypothetical protein